MNTTMWGTFTWRASKHVLPRLRHRTVGRRHHQDRSVHLRRTRDHVLHVVRVTRAIHVRVVTASDSYSTWAVAIVIPRSRSSGALSIWSNGVNSARPFASPAAA